jgi:hypothetical protein
MRTILQDPANIEAWKLRGATVPEAVPPAQYSKEIADRIAFYKKLIKAKNLLAE